MYLYGSNYKQYRIVLVAIFNIFDTFRFVYVMFAEDSFFFFLEIIQIRKKIKKTSDGDRLRTIEVSIISAGTDFPDWENRRPWMRR